MLTLIHNAYLYAPEDLGVCDVLVSGSTVHAVAPKIEVTLRGAGVERVDAAGRWLVPGFVDSLVHITGGGGEGGFRTRTPELRLEEAVRGGVTTLVGALGTDAVTRSLGELFAKAKALTEEGVSCFLHTGSYAVPPVTLTGSVRTDVLFVDPIIGVGELAIADHRGSQPTVSEMARIAIDARVAGMLAGKGGVVSLHVGPGHAPLNRVYDVVETTEVPITQFYPTHMTRTEEHFQAALEFVRRGGTVDFTTSTTPEILTDGEIKCSRALARAHEAGVACERITFSSDAHGSLPVFDAQGRLQGLDIGRIDSLFGEVRDAILEEGLAPPVSLATITSNPAAILGLWNKGRIAEGLDADLNLIDPQTLEICDVMARGRWLMRDRALTVASAFAEVGR